MQGHHLLIAGLSPRARLQMVLLVTCQAPRARQRKGGRWPTRWGPRRGRWSLLLLLLLSRGLGGLAQAGVLAGQEAFQAVSHVPEQVKPVGYLHRLRSPLPRAVDVRATAVPTHDHHVGML